MSNARKTIEAHEYALKDVFCDKFSFEIPGYQRPYAWTTEHAKILVDDLLTHLEEQKGKMEECNPYFLGSIVLIKGHSTPRSEVVDGQQRLTTLTILFSVLRALREDKFPELESSSTFGKWILQLGSFDLGTEDKPRLQLRSKDQGFFNEHIQEAGGLGKLSANGDKLSDSQENIRENARVMFEVLDAVDDDVLKRLCQFLLSYCYLVIVTTPDIDSAFRIFSVLNDRGLDLDTADIIKSQVIGSLEKKQDHYNQMWEDLEESLGREEFGNLFTHIRMVIRRKKLKQALLKEYKEYIKPEEKPAEFVDSFLSPYAKSYSRVLYDGFDDYKSTDWPEPNKHLQWLKRVDNADWIPTALFYMTKHGGDSGRILRFFEQLERLASIMMILRYDINQRINRYAEVFADIDKGTEFEVDSSLALTAEEKTKARERLDGPVYKTVRTRMPILLRLDSALSDKTATYDHPRISIEHVMPQTPAEDSDWMKACADEEEHQELVHKLGNLVLLSRNKNSSASNYDFDKKKESYFKKGGHSAFVLTHQVTDEDEWTPQVIRDRQKVLVEKLVTEWDL